jgi:Transposase DNA-binding/Transposase Tn5 dimerisation domain
LLYSCLAFIAFFKEAVMKKSAKRKFVNNKKWTLREFSLVHLGDKRLDKRLIKVAQQFLSHSQSPINQACENWAATKAAYRMFKNKKVESSKILLPHQRSTLNRMREYPLILAIQDTTSLNYDRHQKTLGLGSIGGIHNKKINGLMMHTVLAITPQGIPLGILEQNIWSRKDNPLNIGLYRKQVPIENKESNKWITALEKTVLLTNKINTGIVTICDRESDVYEFLLKAKELKTQILIRASSDRLLFGSKRDKKRSITIWKHMRKQPCQGIIEVEITNKEQVVPVRQATLEIRFDEIELRPPQRRSPPKKKNMPLAPIKIYAVWAKEVHSPKGVEKIDWMLLTNISIICLDDAVEKVNWYKLRWHIENFHKVIKSGCKVEDCRLGSVVRLKPYLTLYSIIAWRIYWMTHLIRHALNTPCTDVLTESEWKALYCVIHKTRTCPLRPPSIHEAMRWIAELGGFLGRTGDEEPGIVTIWRGWQRLTDIAETWELLH